MQIYQFIKYNQETTIEHLLKSSETGAVLCFDFEDGIQNPIDVEKTVGLKETYRKYFKNLLDSNYVVLKNLKLGVRLNFIYSNELNKDIKVLESLHLHSIFIPKIERQKELIDTGIKLNSANITYKELIPIIESKKGIENIAEIFNVNSPRIKNVAFGHCDYNLSLKIFPFFHQDSIEYWKWVDKLLLITSSLKINFINSPYLRINDDLFFSSMLNHLSEINKNNFGQITLSNRQSRLCFAKANKDIKFKKIIDNRHDLYVPENYAERLIFDFETNNNEKGLTKFNDEIISYQEYISAKRYIQYPKKKVIDLTFVGGCFSVQRNILFEDHFHQILKRKIENDEKFELNINIIRYERFITVLDKVRKLYNWKKFDVLFFSIRPEPYLRLIKLYYRHINNSGKLKHSLNLPLFNILSSEKYDILILSRKYDYDTRPKKSFFHKYLVDGNYLLGKLIGNQNYALKKYLHLVNGVINYCNSNGIKLIILGPNLRSNTKYEPKLCKDLDRFIKKSMKNIDYIDGLDTLTSTGEPLINKNGTNVNEKYHKLIAKRLFITLKTNELLSPTKAIPNKGFSTKNAAGRQVKVNASNEN